MEHIPVLSDLVIILVVGVFVALVLGRLKLPVLAGLLVAGALVGPSGLSLVKDTDDIGKLAEIGVVLLLFTIGLELNLERLRRIARLIAVGGSLQVGLSIVITSAIAMAMGESWERGVLFGFLVALSSTAIVLRALSERGELDAPHGRFIVGALLFQDLCVVPMVLIIPILGGPGGPGAAAAIGMALLKAVTLLLVTISAARHLVPRLFAWVDQIRSHELFVLTVLCICIATAWLTSLAGLSLALGAFLAGVVLADTDYGHRAMSDILPLRHAFTSLFFVSLGMLLDVRVLIEEPLLVGLFLAAFLVLKGVIATVAALAMRFPARVAWLSGAGLAQFGEFGFVLASIGVSHGLLAPQEHRALLAAGVITMCVTPVAVHLAPRLRAGERLLKPLERLLGARGIDEPEARHKKIEEHVVIVGFGVAGKLLARALSQSGVPYLVLELNAETVRMARAAGEPVYYGDITSPEALSHARVDKARALVLLINDPSAARRAVVAARRAAPEAYILVRAHYLSAGKELYDLGATDVVFEELEAGVEVIARIMRRTGQARNEISLRIHEAREATHSSARTQTLPRLRLGELHGLEKLKVESYLVHTGSYAEDKSALGLDLHKRTGALLVAIRRRGALLEQMAPMEPFQAGDLLFLVGSTKAIEAAVHLLEHGPE